MAFCSKKLVFMPMADARVDLSIKYIAFTFFHFNQASWRIKKAQYDVQKKNCPMSIYRHIILE